MKCKFCGSPSGVLLPFDGEHAHESCARPSGLRVASPNPGAVDLEWEKLRRKMPYRYTVGITHTPDNMSLDIADVADSPEDRKRVAADLRRAATMLEDSAAG